MFNIKLTGKVSSTIKNTGFGYEFIVDSMRNKNRVDRVLVNTVDKPNLNVGDYVLVDGAIRTHKYDGTTKTFVLGTATRVSEDEALIYNQAVGYKTSINVVKSNNAIVIADVRKPCPPERNYTGIVLTSYYINGKRDNVYGRVYTKLADIALSLGKNDVITIEGRFNCMVNEETGTTSAHIMIYYISKH